MPKVGKRLGNPLGARPPHRAGKGNTAAIVRRSGSGLSNGEESLNDLAAGSVARDVRAVVVTHPDYLLDQPGPGPPGLPDDLVEPPDQRGPIHSGLRDDLVQPQGTLGVPEWCVDGTPGRNLAACLKTADLLGLIRWISPGVIGTDDIHRAEARRDLHIVGVPP